MIKILKKMNIVLVLSIILLSGCGSSNVSNLKGSSQKEDVINLPSSEKDDTIKDLDIDKYNKDAIQNLSTNSENGIIQDISSTNSSTIQDTTTSEDLNSRP